MIHRRFARWALFVLAVVLGACAQVEAPKTPGYVVLQPAQTSAPADRIVVIEFFWFRCPHCNALYADLKDWAKRQPPDVAMRYHHVVFRDSMMADARLFYTLLAMGESPDRIGDVFEANFLDALDLSNEAVLFDWVAKQGIDRQRFAEAYRSSAVEQQVAAARQRSIDYQLRGVPAFVVDGRYLTSPNISGDVPVLERVQQLVDRVRRERAAGKS
ncbi:MAG: thiol:disulfide interchange protein DsbA/DsbL [Rubrivivax sp.]|nr:thiol:disulfide interchange protein DsbA/DsbL [Rubrivivax sp.]